MNLRQEDLFSLSRSTGFKNTDMLEKVVQLMGLLNEIFDNNYLKTRLALKGGTALNLFYFNLPRLSVDIDFNYIGAIDRHSMLAERKEVEAVLIGICKRMGFSVKKEPKEHAGGKWRLSYASSIRAGGNIEIDLSYLYRVLFFPVLFKDSIPVGAYQANNIPLLDMHELAAGKLAALLSRKASRDVYDVSQLYLFFEENNFLDFEKLRLIFMVYGGMNRRDWRFIKIEDIGIESSELKSKLTPVLSQKDIQCLVIDDLVENCKKIISKMLPFSEKESKFLNRLLDEGDIEPSFLTSDPVVQDKIKCHPGLLWKAQNVKKFKKNNNLMK